MVVLAELIELLHKRFEVLVAKTFEIDEIFYNRIR